MILVSGPDERSRRQSRWALYGIDDAEYLALYDAQDGHCLVCTADFSDDIFGMSVDHDHATGRIRGLLCQPCNAALGLLGDDPVRAEAAAAYLRRRPAVELYVDRERGRLPRREEPRPRGTHCRQGHPFTNRYADGTPYCPTCTKRRRDEAKVLVDHEGEIIP